MREAGPLHIGLTGNIASGKSTVARQLAALGADVIDADVLAREVVARGTAGFDAVVDYFGAAVIATDGSLDRSALRTRVFRDPVARSALNAIVHPAVARLRDQRFAQAAARGTSVVISDIPLLFEVGLENAFDGIIVVDAAESVRHARLMRDRGLSARDADAMLAAQWPSEQKRAGATWVIDNDGSLAQLEARVQLVWSAILERVAHRRSATGAS